MLPVIQGWVWGEGISPISGAGEVSHPRPLQCFLDPSTSELCISIFTSASLTPTPTTFSGSVETAYKQTET